MEIEVPTSLLALLVPAITSILFYGILRIVGKVPQVLVVPVILPLIGMATNYLFVVIGSEGLDVELALILGAAASALQKTTEHIGRAVEAWNKGDSVPMTKKKETVS